jgi:hypothetical protein
MRAYRAADGSFYTWRAGAYDPNMDDASPPFPKVDYSDHVQIGILGGPLARSDAEAFALAGLGTPGVPLTVTIPPIVQTPPGTDCRDFTSISVWFVVTAAPTTPAQVNVRSVWTNTSSPSGPEHQGILNSDDAILNGSSPQNVYTAEYTVNGTAAATGAALGPFNVPVRGRNHLIVISSDTGDVEGYAIAMRFA